MPFFSVIIPLYNKERFVEKTLKSVLAQSFTDFELIIINDGSTDKSAEIVTGFKDERIRYFSEDNQGVSAARNFGITKAASKFITFLDADDYWYPDFLQEMFRNIGRFPEQKIFTAAIEIEMPEKIFPAQYSVEKKSEPQHLDYFESSSKTTIICTSCAVFHKSIFEKVGDFDTQIRSGQDTDLWIRMGLIFKVVFSSKILARYVYDSQSLSKNVAYLTQKLNFSKFSEAEKDNPALKKFLDLNRFSFAIRCKLNNEPEHFHKYRAAIDSRNLSLKKQVLLQLPAALLQALMQLNLFLVKFGISRSVFK